MYGSDSTNEIVRRAFGLSLYGRWDCLNVISAAIGRCLDDVVVLCKSSEFCLQYYRPIQCLAGGS